MKKKVRLLLCILTSAFSIALTACSGDTESASRPDESSLDSSEPVYGGSITVGIPQDIEDSLDPHKAVAAGTKEILFNIYEGLVKPDKTGELVDAVASSHSLSEDGLCYTFTLRDGVRFHDGSDVTAQDVVYSIERYADTDSVSAFSLLKNISAPSDDKVIIELKEPDLDFLSYLTCAIIPESNTDPSTNVIGTGPYKYVSRSPQENIIIKRFDDYWGDKAYLEDVTFKIISDASSIVSSLEAGSIDMFSRLTGDQADQLSGKVNILEGTMNLVQALYLNNSVKPLDDVKVRQAISYAINPQEIIDMTAGGRGTVIGSSVFPSFEKYYMPELADAYAQDIEKSKQLLKEAGYPNGFKLTIKVPSNYQPHVDTAQVIVGQLSNIGVDAKIELIQWNSWLSDVYTDRKYEATVVGVDAPQLTARCLLERFQSEDAGNFINYSNKKYDELCAKAISCTDDKEQLSYYKEMESMLSREAANAYIQDMANLVALSKKYSGYVFYPLYVLDMSAIYLRE